MLRKLVGYAAYMFGASSLASLLTLGVTMLDLEGEGWPSLFVANDTQPNKLYRNRRDGTFEEIGVKAGVAFSEDGKARAGMGADVAVLSNGATAIAVTMA